MTNNHAKLPPSAAYRWLECTASYEFTKDMPVVETIWAKEGTLAHEKLAELIENEYSNKIEPEMLKYLVPCYKYLNKLKENSDLFLIERTVKIEPIEGFGSIDYLILKNSSLHIIDLKYGTSRVKVEDNSQLKLYAYGAYNLIKPIANIEKIVLHIMQPRLNKNGSFTSYEQNIESLIEWARYYAGAKAQEALKGKGIFKAGHWCWFCLGRTICTHLIAKDFN